MPLFTSASEKKLWFYSFLVLLALVGTLFWGRPFLEILGDQNAQTFLFVLGMFLVGILILIHGLHISTTKKEWAVGLGILAVYLLLFLRLGLPERSHLIEYSVLAIFIHLALIERKKHNPKLSFPALWAIVFAFAIGVLDECMQYYIPHRVFDIKDIIFNGFAIAMAIGFSILIRAIRKK